MVTENIAQQMAQSGLQAVTSQMKAEEQRQQKNKNFVEGIAKHEAFGQAKKQAMKIEPVKKTVDKANAGIEKMTGKAKEAFLKKSPVKVIANQMKKALNKVKKAMAKVMKKAVEIKTKALQQASKAKTKAINAGIDATGKALAPVTLGASEGIAQGAKQLNNVAGQVEQKAIKATGEMEKKTIDAGSKIGQDMNDGIKDAAKDKVMDMVGLGKVASVKAKIDSFNKPKEAGQDPAAVIMKEAGKLAMNAMTR